jgi:hypothetical protein
VNYPRRFSRNGAIVLPNEIWVGDIHAQKIAEKLFPSLKIKLLDNPYLSEMRELLKKLKPKKRSTEKHTVLYLCEPMSDSSSYTERDSLQFFMDNIEKVDKDISTIIIRPHPSEDKPEKKYGWVKEYSIKTSCDIQFSKEKNLIQDIVDCDIAVGVETMAMVVSLASGKRVISSIPKKGNKCILPFPEIEHMLDLVKV